MAWNKVPAAHKPIFYSAMPDDDRVSTIDMFGGTAMMVNGYMAAGLWSDSIMVRVGDKAFAKALNKGGAPFDPMGRGKPMKNMVLLARSVIKKGAELRGWLEVAMEFASGLPPKKKKTKKAAGSSKAVKKKAVKKKTANA